MNGKRALHTMKRPMALFLVLLITLVFAPIMTSASNAADVREEETIRDDGLNKAFARAYETDEPGITRKWSSGNSSEPTLADCAGYVYYDGQGNGGTGTVNGVYQFVADPVEQDVDANGDTITMVTLKKNGIIPWYYNDNDACNMIGLDITPPKGYTYLKDAQRATSNDNTNYSDLAYFEVHGTTGGGWPDNEIPGDFVRSTSAPLEVTENGFIFLYPRPSVAKYYKFELLWADDSGASANTLKETVIVDLSDLTQLESYLTVTPTSLPATTKYQADLFDDYEFIQGGWPSVGGGGSIPNNEDILDAWNRLRNSASEKFKVDYDATNISYVTPVLAYKITTADGDNQTARLLIYDDPGDSGFVGKVWDVLRNSAYVGPDGDERNDAHYGALSSNGYTGYWGPVGGNTNDSFTGYDNESDYMYYFFAQSNGTYVIDIALIDAGSADAKPLFTETVTITVSNPSGGGTSNPSGSQTGDSSVTLTINGQEIKAKVNANGVLELIYTEENVGKYADGSGVYNVLINGVEEILVTIPISALQTDDLALETDFGVLIIPNAVLQALVEKYGNTLRLSVKKGSFQVALLDGAGKDILYDDPSHSFTITLPYTLGSGQKSGAVVAIDRDGSILPLAVYKNGSVSFEIFATGVYDVRYNKKSFTDIGGHWAEDSIDFVAARALYSGTGREQFSPNIPMTRAMFATVLANLERADLSGYGTSRFSDVPDGQWYTAAVEWAADKDIVTGVGGGRFAPDTAITREQMAVMLNNYIQYKKYSLKTTSNANAFTDGDRISTWAKDAVSGMQSAGVISGKPGNLFDPKGPATRAEVAAVFARFVENLMR